MSRKFKVPACRLGLRREAFLDRTGRPGLHRIASLPPLKFDTTSQNSSEICDAPQTVKYHRRWSQSPRYPGGHHKVHRWSRSS